MKIEMGDSLRHQKIAILVIVFFLLILTTIVVVFLSQSVGQREAIIQSQASELDNYPLNSDIDNHSIDENCLAVVEHGNLDEYTCYKTATTIKCIGGNRNGKIYRSVPVPIGWGGTCLSKEEWQDYADMGVCGCFTSLKPFPTPTVTIQL